MRGHGHAHGHGHEHGHGHGHGHGHVQAYAYARAGASAHLAGRRGGKARGADGRLLPAEPLYFPPEEVPELRRFMALHDFLGTVDPYGELPKTLA